MPLCYMELTLARTVLNHKSTAFDPQDVLTIKGFQVIEGHILGCLIF